MGVQKENIEPNTEGLAKNSEKGIEAMDEPKKVNSESIEEPIEEKKEKIVESDANKSDLSEFTEQRMFDDMNELRKSGKIDASKGGKRTFRTALELKYNLNKKALKKYEAFVIAFDRITEAVRGEIQNKEEMQRMKRRKYRKMKKLKKAKRKRIKRREKKTKRRKKRIKNREKGSVKMLRMRKKNRWIIRQKRKER